MVIKAFIYHKRAEKYSDCQDCFGINSQNNRIAVSDGMSQSIFPQWWAKILVDDYLENGCMPKDILPLQDKWQRMLLSEIRLREEEAITNPKRDPWRLKNLLAEKSGAGATLCGLTLGKNEWSCECLGDSCVITINYDNTLNIYTSQVGEFGNRPDYFDSFRTGRGEPIRKTINRDVKAILMVTDPFAELFQLHENNIEFIKARFDELQSLTTHESFTELVERWRDEFGMHNDDSTLVFIDDFSNSDFTICHIDNLEELCLIETNNEDNQIIQLSSELTAAIENVNDSNTGNTSEHDFNPETFNEAVDRLKNAVESLLAFYPGKMKERKVKDWLSHYTIQPIKKFLKK
ncbi:MAG: protein phosphatase 2C domain-containing protein [Muribaculum sp.]|nr:protein phosphatase 2C domain-containing protein [Muribaculum sp.]